MALKLWLENKNNDLNSHDANAIVCTLAKSLHQKLIEIIRARQKVFPVELQDAPEVEAVKKLHHAMVNLYKGDDRRRISDILGECFPDLTASIRRSGVAHSRPSVRRPMREVPAIRPRTPTQDGGIVYKKTDRKVRIQQKEHVLYLGKNNRHFVKMNGIFVSVASLK